MFAAYVSQHGHAFIDRALYLPEVWTDDTARMAKAHVPKGVGFATKPRLATDMIERAIAAKVWFSWVAADTVYGVGELETALRRANKGYVLGGVSTTHQFQSWSAKLSVSGTAKEIAQALNASTWQRLSAGEGTKGARFYDWAYLELADLDTGKFYPGSDGLWTRGLLVRRSLADDKLAYFTTWCPAGTGADKLVQVEGCPWAIEDSFETAKNEFELDHNETQSRDPGTRDPGTPVLIRWSVQEIRHIATRLAQQRIQAALGIAWSVWRRAHQAVAQRSQLKQKMQL